MARLLQYSRKAIEQVINVSPNSFFLEAGQTYILNNSVVFLAGVSDRVNTCSDLHGIYVAVFTKDPDDRSRIKFLDLNRKLECGGAVLLRNRLRDEFNPEIHLNLTNAHLAVEGLRNSDKIDHIKWLFFRPNGKVGLYVPGVTAAIAP